MCGECFDVGEWTEHRNNARGVRVFCGCPAGVRRQALLEALS